MNLGSTADSIEHATCRGCGQPIFRYVTVRAQKAPFASETTTSWWFHKHEQTFACDQTPEEN